MKGLSEEGTQEVTVGSSQTVEKDVRYFLNGFHLVYLGYHNSGTTPLRR